MNKAILCMLFGLFLFGRTIGQNGGASPDHGDKSLLVQHADLPMYPDMAKVARVSGTVRVKVTVQDGNVVITEVLLSSAPILVNAVIENLKTWKFLPKTNSQFITTYVYVLEKKEAEFPENPRIQMQLPKFVKITVRPTKPTCMDCGASKPVK